MVIAKHGHLKNYRFDLCNLAKIASLHSSYPRLQEFSGGYYEFEGGVEEEGGVEVHFPPQLHRLGLGELTIDRISLFLPIGHHISSLKLGQAHISGNQMIGLILHFQNLEQLMVHNGLGDEGLKVLFSLCKKLKKLDALLVYSDDVYLPVKENGVLTLSEGCPNLEHLSVALDKITNSALEGVGSILKGLRTFEMLMLNRGKKESENLLLDEGVKNLLTVCPHISKFLLSFSTRQVVGISDIGLQYIGENGRHVKHMTLWNDGGTNEGMRDFAKGCLELQTLAMWETEGKFSGSALAEVARRHKSLKYFPISGHFDGLSPAQFHEMASDARKM